MTPGTGDDRGRRQASHPDDPRVGRASGGRARSSRTPILAAGTSIAAILSVLGLAVATVLSVSLLDRAPTIGDAGGSPGTSGGGGGVVGRPTPNPSVVITPPPDQRPDIAGALLFVRTGNVWVASGKELRQITSKGTDSAPDWGADGRTIYFAETRTAKGRAPYQGRESNYTFYYPVMMRTDAEGGERTEVHDTLYRLRGSDQSRWFTWMLQHDVSPDGQRFALVSDAPDPMNRDLTLSLMPTAGGTIQNLNLQQARPLGHNDPAWRPDGRAIAFSYNERQGAVGGPRIALYTLASRRLTFISKQGYAQPSWSPDGRYIAAVRTTGRSRDVVILRASDGAEVGRVTRDGGSFAPEWAPDGKQIAYLTLHRQAIDLRVATITGQDAYEVADDRPVTEDGSIDPLSPPSWYMPPELRPTPAPSSPEATASTRSPAVTRRP